MVQRRIVARVLSETKPLKPPLAARLLAIFPFLRRIPRHLFDWYSNAIKSNRVNDKNVKGFLTSAPSTCGRYFVSAVLLR
jgi:hypothetical protein